MSLPAPNLDDRQFQQLVDEAKRLVQQRCPEWTDHNVSDPGVTLIEAFAQMVDQLIYRLNRVPDRHYVKFLELIGIELRPPSAARSEVTFWLSAPQPQPVLVRAETEVATPRTDVEDAVVFTTVADLLVRPAAVSHVLTQGVGGDPVAYTAALAFGHGFACFSPTPAPGDALLVGLSDAVPSCAIVLRLACEASGVGVDPRNPPLLWEAWTGRGWQPCEVGRDDTGGLNGPGEVLLHVPREHQTSVLAGQRAGWLRCRLVMPEHDQPTYAQSPRITDLTAFTVGGTVRTAHAEVVRHEVIGTSDGTPAQRFLLQRRPVVPWEDPCLIEACTGADLQVWRQVQDFAGSGPTDRHFRIDAYAGEIHFGPTVREADGSHRQYGAIPAKGLALRVPVYRTGGGRRGNVVTGAVRVLKTSVPYVARVENRAPAVGGAEAETVEAAKARGPVLLRSRGRAVTGEDFEELAREVAPDAARVHAVGAETSDDAGGVRLLVVPHVFTDELGRVPLADLVPPEATLARISAHLDARRLIGTRLLVEPPIYVGLTAIVSVEAETGTRPSEVQQELLRALYRYFHPLEGGADGCGWPFGRAVQTHEVHALVARLPGVEAAREISVALFPADPVTGRRLPRTDRLDLPPRGLVFSYDHQVLVRA